MKTESIDHTKGSDRIWASANAFCARLPDSLICWETAEGDISKREPTVFEGVGSVRSVVLQETEGCAISNLGSGCFRVEQNEFAKGPSTVPEEYIAFGGKKRLNCTRDKAGVSCFLDKIENAKLMSVFGKPTRIHASLRGKAMCTEQKYELRCYTLDDAGKLMSTVRIRGVRSAQSIRIDDVLGSVIVLDSTGLKFTGVKPEDLQGRPVEGNQVTYPAEATFELKPVDGVHGAKWMTAESSWTYVLDDVGVKSIKVGKDTLEVLQWPLSFKPTAIWQGKAGFFFAAHARKLSMHGWKGKERLNKELRGVNNPKDVATGDFYTCVVHDGGVSCLKNVR